MIRTLLIIAGAALILAVAALGGAAALGGRDLAANGWAWEISEDDGDGLRFQRLSRDEADVPSVTRTLEWTGADTLSVASFGQVVYVQGAEAGVSITGPQALVDRVTLNGGALALDHEDDRVVVNLTPTGVRGLSDRERLRVVVTAPSVTRFEVRGDTKLSIRQYDQPSLAIELAGSGEAEATGRADRAVVDIAGSGDVDLSGLRLTDAAVTISGSGEARMGPTGQADIDIRGSGEVELTTRPERVRQSISGSGEVRGG